MIRRKLSIDRIKELYIDDLTKKDLEYLDTLLDTFSKGIYTINTSVISDLYGRKVMIDGRKSTREDTVSFSTTREIDEHIVYFKTDVEHSILSYYNELGEVKELIVENDFEFDKSIGHISIEKKWIVETWKQVLLGEFYSGIYIKPEIMPVQIYDAKGHNKLPIIGKKGLLNGIYINPIPKRIIPNLALHEILTLQIERQMAKYKGTMEIIPQSMFAAQSGQDAKGQMLYKIMDNTIIYDDSKIDFNTIAQGYRLVGDDTSSNYIKTLIDYRSIVKAEAWDMANMNDSRYGHAAPSSAVTNNQQNIYNAKLGSLLMITIFNNILLKLYTMIIKYGKYAYVDGKSGTAFNKKDGSISYLNINSHELTANKYGLFVSNSIIDFQKLKEYKDFAFAAAQNGEFGLASEAIDSSSVSGIRKHVNQFIKDKEDYERNLKQQEMSQAQQINDANIKEKQDARAAKSADIKLKEDLTTDREVLLAGMENDKKINNN